MINLLPKELKQSTRAARSNVILQRYLIFIGSSALFMLLIFAVGYYITTQERAAVERELKDLKASSVSYEETKKQAVEFEKNLSTAKSILSNEVMFSELIVGIAKSLPEGAVLTDLNLTTATFGQGITLNARTRDEEGGLRLKTALQNSGYFENVSIQTITNPSSDAPTGSAPDDPESSPENRTIQEYPYTVIMNATLLKQEAVKQTEGAQ